MKSTWTSASGRLRALATGTVHWCDPDTGVVDEVDHLSWRDRWAIFGVHSWAWAWVRRFGERDCGCTINPVTRRRVLTRMDCPEHGVSWDELKGCGEGCGCGGEK